MASRNRVQIQGPVELCLHCREQPARRIGRRFTKYCCNRHQRLEWEQRFKARNGGLSYNTAYFRGEFEMCERGVTG